MCNFFMLGHQMSLLTSSRWVVRKGFQLSQFRISTTESEYLVYTKRLYGASAQALGGCACHIRDSNNYFILLGKVKSQSESNLFNVPNASHIGVRLRNGTYFDLCFRQGINQYGSCDHLCHWKRPLSPPPQIPPLT